MAKKSNRTTEVLVVKGVNVSALRGQSIKTGRIFNNNGFFAWQIANEGARDRGRFAKKSAQSEIKQQCPLEQWALHPILTSSTATQVNDMTKAQRVYRVLREHLTRDEARYATIKLIEMKWSRT